MWGWAAAGSPALLPPRPEPCPGHSRCLPTLLVVRPGRPGPRQVTRGLRRHSGLLRRSLAGHSGALPTPHLCFPPPAAPTPCEAQPAMWATRSFCKDLIKAAINLCVHRQERWKPEPTAGHRQETSVLSLRGETRFVRHGSFSWAGQQGPVGQDGMGWDRTGHPCCLLALAAAFLRPSLPDPHSTLLAPPGSMLWHFPGKGRTQSAFHPTWGRAGDARTKDAWKRRGVGRVQLLLRAAKTLESGRMALRRGEGANPPWDDAPCSSGPCRAQGDARCQQQDGGLGLPPRPPPKAQLGPTTPRERSGGGEGPEQQQQQ